MSPIGVTLLISGAGLVLSLIGSAYISGVRWGSVTARIGALEATLPQLATREQLAGLREDLAEIKGMFRMVPRETDQAGRL